jgi:transposase
MDYHHHARLTVYGREHLCRSVVEGRLSLREAAAERGLSRQSAAKWVRWYRECGVAGLEDRSSRPARSPRSTPPDRVEMVERLRRERWTGVRIAQATGLSRATVSRILVRLKLNKVKMLEPQVPVVRYEHAAPGDLLHIDIKKLARIHKPGHRITGHPQDEIRGAGWEFLYVAVDDHSRMAYVAMMPDEKAVSSSSFLHQAYVYFARHNIHLRRVMTDNGPCFISACSAMPAEHCICAMCVPASTPRAPTARLNASSRPPSESGPMRASIRTQQNEIAISNPGYISTTGIDPHQNAILVYGFRLAAGPDRAATGG